MIAVVVSQIFAFLYWVGPNVKQPGYRWVSPGGFVAVGLWILASGAFAFYVANFGSYSKTYGSMAAVIIFLIWLWITNLVMLLGRSSTRRSSAGARSRAATTRRSSRSSPTARRRRPSGASTSGSCRPWGR